MMSDFLARDVGLRPSVSAMVASSARSLRSRVERSRLVESTLTGPLSGLPAARRRCSSGDGPAPGALEPVERVATIVESVELDTMGVAPARRGSVRKIPRPRTRTTVMMVASAGTQRQPPAGDRRIRRRNHPRLVRTLMRHAEPVLLATRLVKRFGDTVAVGGIDLSVGRASGWRCSGPTARARPPPC